MWKFLSNNYSYSPDWEKREKEIKVNLIIIICAIILAIVSTVLAIIDYCEWHTGVVTLIFGILGFLSVIGTVVTAILGMRNKTKN